MPSTGHEVSRYTQAQADARGFVIDPTQYVAMLELQRLYDALTPPNPLHAWLHSIIKSAPIRGVYLWGGVGRGKSFMMDAFFACLPLQHKRRMHFHQFMHEVHARLASLQGQLDPLTSLAQEIAQQVRVLCLDEFVIHDIADAMLMRGLLTGLTQHGVVLVVTSNVEPAALYAGGLQFNQFSPCIALITASLAVVHVDGGQDYRRNTLAQADVYHTPLNPTTDAKLATIFHTLASSEYAQNVQLTINARLISARYQAADVAWFEFYELCVNPCGSADYRHLAARFHTIILSGVPQFDVESITSARRFLWLVDALYDARVKLILSAAVPLAQLAQSDLFGGEFERALSRLTEMQSQAYLSGHTVI